MEYSFEEIELEKKEFKKYIIVLKKFTTCDSFEFLKTHKKIIHIITSMIAKYHSYSDWFFKTFLVYCLEDKKFIYYMHYKQDKTIYETYFKAEFLNIIHILRKYHTSEIFEFIVKTYGKILAKENNKKNWYNKDNFFNFNFFKFIYHLVIQIQNDIKIPNTFSFDNTITKQLLYRIVKKYRLIEPIYLRNDYS